MPSDPLPAPVVLGSTRRSLLGCGLGLAMTRAPASIAGSDGKVLRVGAKSGIATLSHAARLAQSGTTIEVEPGDYAGDVAVWTQDDLTLRASAGSAWLRADGAAAEDKAIWVIRGRRVTVEGFNFVGARVASRNGAGIRFEAGSLHVRNCGFFDNEMGLLTGNDPTAELTIETSEFAYNKRSDGHNHNLYVGTIGKLTVTASYFHHATTGHLLKSRAAVNHIFYNRLTDEIGGRASYEIDLPNGGVAVVVGNIIEQSAETENAHMVSFGVEGYRWPTNALIVVHNTFVDRLREAGMPLRVAPGAGVVRGINNLVSGSGARLDAATSGDFRGNAHLSAIEHDRLLDGDHRPRAGAAFAEVLVDPGRDGDRALGPTHEYAHPRRLRPLVERPRLQGALQGLSARA